MIYIKAKDYLNKIFRYYIKAGKKIDDGINKTLNTKIESFLVS